MAVDLVALLRQTGPQLAGRLVTQLGISRATLSRAVRAAGDELVSRGSARRTAYAARRALRGVTAPLPIYRVGQDGMPTEIAQLALIHPEGSAVESLTPLGWPLDEAMRDGWFDGLPYPLHDLRPQGFLGRHFARRHAAVLQVSDDPASWSDDDALQAMSLMGDDLPGDLIVGEAACRLWLAQVQAFRSGEATPAVADRAVAKTYPALAEAALTHGTAGSSAGGEFPKFTALRRFQDDRLQPVLVKFSGSDDAPGTRRWADLLVCEHLAGEVVRAELGIEAACSRIYTAGGRTFLEVDRFDRHGPLGRSPLMSWSSLNAALVGAAGRPWADGVAPLQAAGWLAAEALDAVRTVWLFGLLIGNTDMHDGNLSFCPSLESPTPTLALAPIYDMLPMLYAPVRGVELPTRLYQPRLPLPAESAAWQRAAPAAHRFWQLASRDRRISAPFRQLCADNAVTLARLLD